LVVKGGVADAGAGEVHAGAYPLVKAGLDEMGGGALVVSGGVVLLRGLVGGGGSEISDGSVDERAKEAAEGLGLSVEILVGYGGCLRE